MNRAEYLARAWRSYPPAENGWLDVEGFLALESDSTRAAKAIVCGRLLDDGWLSSAGQRIQVRWTPEIASLTEGEASAARWLQVGDVVAFRIHATDGAAWLADRCLLLAPGRARIAPRSSFAPERSRQWMNFIQAVRAFFIERGFIEALTPTLVASPGTEPYLDAFATDWEYGSRVRRFYLPTSPEFHLKKMLAQGWTRLFEIKTCFRNGEIGPHHQPEFQMLEWYRAYSDLDAIADDVAALLGELGSKLGRGDLRLERTTIAALFAEAFDGFQLKPETKREELMELARRSGIAVSSDDSFDDVFFRLFLERIEPRLGETTPLLVRGYPPSQAALARIGADGFADRFEVYWRGLELANAFHELNDPDENAARFTSDADRKRELGRAQVPIDEELLQWIQAGLPPSGGIALGLDRLFMALVGLERISETRAFPECEP